MADFVAGAVGGAFGVAVGYPLDTIKVRIQTQRAYSGVWHCIHSTYKREKISGFFKGMSMPVSTVSVSSSIIFGTYRNCLHNICKLRYGNAEVKPSKLDIFASGYAAGAVQVVVTSPADVAKVRLQTQMHPHHSVQSASLVSGPKYHGPVHCLMTIVREEGFLGLYKGCAALMCRDCPSFATYFLSYAVLREWLVPAGQNKSADVKSSSKLTTVTKTTGTKNNEVYTNSGRSPFWWVCWNVGMDLSHSHGCYQGTSAGGWPGPAEVSRSSSLYHEKRQTGGPQGALQGAGAQLPACLPCKHGGIFHIRSDTEADKTISDIEMCCTNKKTHHLFATQLCGCQEIGWLLSGAGTIF
ncbi:solute carrier family 25 member 47 isoform X1 [Pleurodeles waltl]|uniref:solute carrier family 25 member 47 isoform X1 n=1 Tax=Pleurodeles waltl TaxID=8319 RepID=UPI003709A123